MKLCNTKGLSEFIGRLLKNTLEYILWFNQEPRTRSKFEPDKGSEVNVDIYSTSEEEDG